jgi:hypothetical protein
MSIKMKEYEQKDDLIIMRKHILIHTECVINPALCVHTHYFIFLFIS